MNDTFTNEWNKSIDDLLEKIDSSGLADIGMVADVSFKVTIAEFLYDVVVVAALHDIHNLDDVLWFKHLKNLNLWEESRF